MVKTFVPLLMISSILLSGCINRTPPTPTVSPAQLTNALTETELRLAEQMEQQCQGWQDRQQTNFDQYQLVQKGQRQLDQRLEQIENKLDTPPVQPAVITAKKPSQCPQPVAVTDSKNLGNKIVVGKDEWLWIESVNRVYEARIDTGAKTSSISALDITPFEKDGKRWVRFRLAPDDSDDSFEIEAPLVRYVKIRQASSNELDRRPVASLTVRLGKMTEVAEFTLTDRTQMSYPILLGREFLRDVAIVDVARENIQPKPAIVEGQPQLEAVSKTKKQ
ncbi:ATP-dependent zinc protease [Methylophaga thiooxydans]|uniref:ATP-dependent zinc protease family protein n=1 Tax=Methylophaga thiooxydans TaxID=392484 RepID=UPI002352A1D6|nr:ATP-dependent zinc protease [Methylophaga thiooxydans]